MKETTVTWEKSWEIRGCLPLDFGHLETLEIWCFCIVSLNMNSIRLLCREVWLQKTECRFHRLLLKSLAPVQKWQRDNGEQRKTMKNHIERCPMKFSAILREKSTQKSFGSNFFKFHLNWSSFSMFQFLDPFFYQKKNLPGFSPHKMRFVRLCGSKQISRSERQEGQRLKEIEARGLVGRGFVWFPLEKKHVGKNGSFQSYVVLKLIYDIFNHDHLWYFVWLFWKGVCACLGCILYGFILFYM